ncbi:tektin-1 isoform X2 [Pseudomyrmex gracilis]|uniref:tektin-1 isoform X2 n=1 Tax=Pseudomyrmex gracilis TaxID=219809 RepID=UPI00099549FD|nr:tektin-1 isoform X2 [Pseudomyrmex gracilis]
MRNQRRVQKAETFPWGRANNYIQYIAIRRKPKIMDCASTTTSSFPSRFTIDQWHLNNQFRYQCSEAQQKLSERLLADAARACDFATEIAKVNKEETDHQLKEKLNDIEFRKEELLRIRKDLVLEIDALPAYKERITDVLKIVRGNASTICKNCLITRERRLGVDLVHDDVEKNLLKERETIQTADNFLSRVSEETCEQIRKLKATLHCIDRDLENKKCNLCIHRHTMSLKETDFDLNTHRDAHLHRDKSEILVSEWEQQTNDNVNGARKEVDETKRLRCYIDTIIKQTIDDLNRQRIITNEAFKQRIEETRKVKIKMELQHSEIVKQIDAMSNNIARIKKSIADKEGYLALAYIRIDHRCQRPETELTQDLVEANLVKEIHELRNIVANLQQTLYEAEASLRYLLKTQIKLAEDINVKMNTLKIDEVECLTLRQSLDYSCILKCYY